MIDDSRNDAKHRALAMADRLEVMARGLDGEGLHDQAEKNRAKAKEIRKANK